MWKNVGIRVDHLPSVPSATEIEICTRGANKREKKLQYGRKKGVYCMALYISAVQRGGYWVLPPDMREKRFGPMAGTDPRREGGEGRSLREFVGRNCLLVYCPPPGFPFSPPTTIMNPRAMQGEEGREEEELLSLYCTRGGIPPGGATAKRTFVSQVNINMHEKTFPPEGPIWWSAKDR